MISTNRLLLMFLFAAGASISPAQAKDRQWKPVGKWGFDIAGDRCAAGHAFESGNSRVVLGLDSLMTSRGMALAVESSARRTGPFATIEVNYGAGFGKTFATIVPSATPKKTLHQFHASREDMEQLSASRRLTVSDRSLRADLPLAGLADALTTLEKCTAELLEKWGLNREDQARIASFPEPIGNIVQPSDYPLQAIRDGSIGRVEARLTVHPDGTATDCHIVRSSGHESLDATTCTLAERARFSPAVDRGGQAMKSPYHLRIRWLVE